MLAGLMFRGEDQSVCGVFSPFTFLWVSRVGSTIVIKTWCFSFTDVDFKCLFRP